MIILASGSPRRAKLLTDAGIKFKIITSDVEETFDPNLEPKEVAMYLARLKAKHIADSHPNDIVIGSDTIVVFNNKILGKPIDEQDAFRMLDVLSDQWHTVYTGVSMIKGDIEDNFFDQTKVKMKALSHLEIKAYIKTGEPMDKAGSYGIQGEGRHLVEKYEGDFFTIMGLPLKKVLDRLKNQD